MPLFPRNSVGGLAPDANELYYDILIKNNAAAYQPGVGTSLPPVRLSFQETRSNPYLSNPSDYYMAVVSFELDTQSLPVFVCDTIPGSNNVNDTIYAVTLDDGAGTYITRYIVWSPEDLNAVVPPTPVPANYNDYPYYYSYSYTWFINLVNSALATAYSTIGGVSRAPFIIFENGLISIVGSVTQFDSSAPVYKIYFNTALYELFSSFTYKYEGNANSILEMNYQVIFNANPSGDNVKTVYSNLATTPPSGGYLAIYNSSEYSPLPYWNPVDSIIFTTQQMPVVPELIAKPTLYGSESVQFTGVNANTYYVLADYAAPLYSGTEYRPNISYVPLAEYRLVDLYGEESLNALQIDVYWKDAFGTLHPFLLQVNGSAYIKIMFRKKTFYSAKD
jgi:hypothetical protein